MVYFIRIYKQYMIIINHKGNKLSLLVETEISDALDLYFSIFFAFILFILPK
jgi:hypothetical protein